LKTAKKARKGGIQTNMGKKLSVQELLAQLQGMSQDELTALKTGMKDNGVKLSSAKEKVFVANRVQITDTKPDARRPRKAGEVTQLTEKALLATLQTWIRGKDAEVKIPLVIASIKAGHTEDFKTFRIEGMKA
jgi:hypothetical protein